MEVHAHSKRRVQMCSDAGSHSDACDMLTPCLCVRCANVFQCDAIWTPLQPCLHEPFPQIAMRAQASFAPCTEHLMGLKQPLHAPHSVVQAQARCAPCKAPIEAQKVGSLRPPPASAWQPPLCARWSWCRCPTCACARGVC